MQKPSVVITTSHGCSTTCLPCPQCPVCTSAIHTEKKVNNDAPNMSSDVSSDLHSLMSELIENHRASRSSAVRQQLQSSINKVIKLMFLEIEYLRRVNSMLFRNYLVGVNFIQYARASLNSQESLVVFIPT